MQLCLIDLDPARKRWAAIETITPMISGSVPLLVLKVAYCYAVAERKIEALNSNAIRNILAGSRHDVYNFVGSADVSTQVPRRNFHELFFRDQGKWLTVLVALFASYKAPVWEVVVGEI